MGRPFKKFDLQDRLKMRTVLNNDQCRCIFWDDFYRSDSKCNFCANVEQMEELEDDHLQEV